MLCPPAFLRQLVLLPGFALHSALQIYRNSSFANAQPFALQESQ